MTEAQQTVLAEIRASYDRARLAANREAVHQSNVPPLTCRYCGMHWRLWNGSKLDGHAKCIVTPEFKAQLAASIRDTLIPYSAVGEAVGVSSSVVRSWVATIWGRR